MDRTELGTVLTSFIDASTEDRGEIINNILSENDRMNEQISSLTSGIPEGFDSWQDAYNNLSDKYVKRFINGGVEDTKGKPEVRELMAPVTMSVDDACKAFVEEVYNRKF